MDEYQTKSQHANTPLINGESKISSELLPEVTMSKVMEESSKTESAKDNIQRLQAAAKCCMRQILSDFTFIDSSELHLQVQAITSLNTGKDAKLKENGKFENRVEVPEPKPLSIEENAFQLAFANRNRTAGDKGETGNFESSHKTCNTMLVTPNNGYAINGTSHSHGGQIQSNEFEASEFALPASLNEECYLERANSKRFAKGEKPRQLKPPTNIKVISQKEFLQRVREAAQDSLNGQTITAESENKDKNGAVDLKMRQERIKYKNHPTVHQLSKCEGSPFYDALVL